MSKGKTAFICVLLTAVAMAVPLYLQQQGISKLRQDNEGLNKVAAQVEPLQAQVEKLTQDAVNTGDAQAQVKELARLRAQAAQMRTQSNELARARQQIASLNQRMAAQAEAQQAQITTLQTQAGAAVQQSAAIKAMNACINNLRLIDAAKQQWALEFKKGATDIPTADDIRPYLGRGAAGELPVCPAGGTYTFNSVGERPVCSIPGHELPH